MTKEELLNSTIEKIKIIQNEDSETYIKIKNMILNIDKRGSTKNENNE